MVDKHQVQSMYCTGLFTQAQIAQRLDISSRTVARCVADLPDNLRNTKQVLGLADTEDEPEMWFYYYKQGLTLRQVAYTFGVSHEKVRQECMRIEWEIICNETN